MIFDFYDLKLARSTSIQSHFNKFWNSYDILKLTWADLWWPLVTSSGLGWPYDNNSYPEPTIEDVIAKQEPN